MYVIFYNIILNNITMKLSEIYVRTTDYLLQDINIIQLRKKSNILC